MIEKLNIHYFNLQKKYFYANINYYKALKLFKPIIFDTVSHSIFDNHPKLHFSTNLH